MELSEGYSTSSGAKRSFARRTFGENEQFNRTAPFPHSPDRDGSYLSPHIDLLIADEVVRKLELLKKFALALLCAVGLASAASAQIISGDFNESLDLPEFSAAGPRVLQALNVPLPSVSPQLTAANTISNPSGWNNVLEASFDPTTNILSLAADSGNTYQIITFTLSNIQFALPGQQILGFAPLNTGNAVGPDTGPVPTLLTSFTANSFTVSYSIPIGTGDDFAIGNDPDTFQVLVGAASAPEPGSIALAACGALPLAGMMIRRRRTA